MKKIALIFIGLLLALYVAAIYVPFEPDERRPGTRLGGDLAEVQDTDWSFLQGRNQIFVETRTCKNETSSMSSTLPSVDTLKVSFVLKLNTFGGLHNAIHNQYLDTLPSRHFVSNYFTVRRKVTSARPG